MKKKKRHNKKKSIAVYTLILCFLVAGLIFAGIEYFVTELENGLIEVSAKQQDNYVELVKYQISLEQGTDGQQKIQDIISGIDASADKFWTLSEKQQILFIKDVLETNRYKGFSTNVYYSSESAGKFLDSLSEDTVKHSIIDIDQKQYIASGVVFSYMGIDYKICLLTNKDVILQNNSVMEAKISFLTLVLLLILFFISLASYLSYRLDKMLKKNEQLKGELVDAQYRLSLRDELQNTGVQREVYHDIWGYQLLPTFVEKLRKKECIPVTFVRVRCKDYTVSEQVLEKAKLLDAKFVRFRIDKEQLLFLCIQYHDEEAKEQLQQVIHKKAQLERVVEVDELEKLNLLWILKELEKDD